MSDDEKVGLWFGTVDDLWKMGPPRGTGGPWKDTDVRSGNPSDPYLMTGYDSKTVELSHDRSEAVEFTLEVDFLADIDKDGDGDLDILLKPYNHKAPRVDNVSRPVKNDFAYPAGLRPRLWVCSAAGHAGGFTRDGTHDRTHY